MDRQIGEAIARFVLLADAAARSVDAYPLGEER